MGKRMLYVVTHQQREPWERPGGTQFYFVNDWIGSALEQAKDAAGDRDVRIAGGSDTIVQHLSAGLVDEFTIALSPVLFGAGTRLFDNVDASKIALEPIRLRMRSASAFWLGDEHGAGARRPAGQRREPGPKRGEGSVRYGRQQPGGVQAERQADFGASGPCQPVLRAAGRDGAGRDLREREQRGHER